MACIHGAGAQDDSTRVARPVLPEKETGNRASPPVPAGDSPATASVESSSRPNAELDPSDIWYRGFLLVQAAEDLEKRGKLLEALNKLTEAEPLYGHLGRQFPEFQPEIVKQRRHLIAEKRTELKERMRAPSRSTASASGSAGFGRFG